MLDTSTKVDAKGVVAILERYASDSIVRNGSGDAHADRGGRGPREAIGTQEKVAQHGLGATTPLSIMSAQLGVRLRPRVTIHDIRHERGPGVGNLRRSAVLVAARGRPGHVHDDWLRRLYAALGGCQAPVGASRCIENRRPVVQRHAKAD